MLFNSKLPLLVAVTSTMLLVSGCDKSQEAATSAEQVMDEAVDALDLDHEDVFSLKVGQCFDEDSGSTLDSSEEEVDSIPMRECSEEHDYEVYHSFNLADAPVMPVGEETDNLIFTSCETAFDTYVGKSYDDSYYDYYTFTPTDGSWAQGDREVLCFLFDPEGAKLTGSLKGIAK